MKRAVREAALRAGGLAPPVSLWLIRNRNGEIYKYLLRAQLRHTQGSKKRVPAALAECYTDSKR